MINNSFLYQCTEGGLIGLWARKADTLIFLGYWLHGEGAFCTKYLIYLFS